MGESFAGRGGYWVLGQSVLMLAVIGLGIVFRDQWPAPASIIVGAVCVVVGGWLGIAGAQALGRNRTAFPKPQADSTLVQTGVYGVVRHPLYASVILLAAGWSCLWRSAPALGAAALLILFLDAKARREERWLRATFQVYAEYARRVRRLIPWVY